MAKGIERGRDAKKKPTRTMKEKKAERVARKKADRSTGQLIKEQ